MKMEPLVDVKLRPGACERGTHGVHVGSGESKSLPRRTARRGQTLRSSIDIILGSADFVRKTFPRTLRFLGRVQIRGATITIRAVSAVPAWLAHADAVLHGGHVPLDVARAAADTVARNLLVSAAA